MHIVILGNGIAGITAARYIRKLSGHDITVISAETDHFFSRTALMYIYMGHMRYEDTKPYEDWFWEKNRIQLLRTYIKRIDFNARKLYGSAGEVLAYDKLLLATGSASNKFGWPGQDLQGVGGLYSYQDLENMERFSDGLQRAVIVGGGLIGIEMAEMFHSRHIPVTFLVREESYWDMVLPPEESAMVNRHIRENGINLRLSTELKEIVDDGQGRACAVITNTGERIDCGYVGLTAGVHPNVGFLKDSGLEIERGILVNEFLETNIPHVYAAGDCVQHRNPLPGRRPIEAVWYTGRMAGEVAAYNICGTSGVSTGTIPQGGQQVAYDPGIWFNSAKFIDIEYQVYGEVPAQLPDSYASLYWEHPDGRKSIRLVYNKGKGNILGFNLMGVRYRHEVCEKWIKEQTHIEVVLQNLGIANFDPEFYRQYEEDLIALYNRQSGKNLQLEKRRGLAGALRFLKGQPST
ncbi:MAG: NAD(P)/FAD-dependent oxidoreductase [Phaeodactylibacter sp.]|nr:NAD(P)/FAD-dependent oxidoreductase [Phaeodactylibacter sp.]MCB9054114.1 NAD(P)/FAD-dependent oxidoreductase [Lewinellaceae bacterium]